MQATDLRDPSLSLVSWARTARPVRWEAPFRGAAALPRERNPAPVDTTDDVLFGFSTVALMLMPLAMLAVVLLG